MTCLQAVSDAAVGNTRTGNLFLPPPVVKCILILRPSSFEACRGSGTFMDVGTRGCSCEGEKKEVVSNYLKVRTVRCDEYKKYVYLYPSS
ncbi:rna binding protein [Moniliophthora roreri]|nr:rna binding protein [Moniliophthora roreri]